MTALCRLRRRRSLQSVRTQLARDSDVPVSRVGGIIAGERAITADTALRLSCYFGTIERFWLNLQSDYDLRVAKQTVWPKIKDRIRRCEVA